MCVCACVYVVSDATQALFQPSLIGHGTKGIHELTFQAIMKCEVDLRRDLYSDIVVCGGSTLLPGIVERMTKEMSTLAPPSVRIKVQCCQRDSLSLSVQYSRARVICSSCTAKTAGNMAHDDRLYIPPK